MRLWNLLVRPLRRYRARRAGRAHDDAEQRVHADIAEGLVKDRERRLEALRAQAQVPRR